MLPGEIQEIEMKYTVFVDVTAFIDIEADTAGLAVEKAENLDLNIWNLEYTGGETNVACYPKNAPCRNPRWVFGPMADREIERLEKATRQLDILSLLKDGQEPEEKELNDAF